MKNNFFPRFGNKLATGVLIFVFCYLAASWGLAYLIDIRNIDVLGIKSWLEAAYPEAPILWLQMFREASVTEVLQWTFLAGSIVTVVLYLNLNKRTHVPPVTGWKLAGIGFSLMFLEDTLNIRHRTA
ncbi:MAG: hypothetical protein FH749_00695 [Firmicutes bacterium]|nr:hypothetical protein [Bacillota bacterium]